MSRMSALAHPAALGAPLARAGASVVDGLAVGVPGGALLALLDGGLVAGLAVCLALALLYAPPLLARPGERNGQTWGKQLLGLRVVREDGRPVTAGIAVLRELVGKAGLGALTLGLGVAWLLLDLRRRGLHDRLAGTLVVRAQATTRAVVGTAGSPA
jgi:uncharacterized RDD family membrane protein YckC